MKRFASVKVRERLFAAGMGFVIGVPLPRMTLKPPLRIGTFVYSCPQMKAFALVLVLSDQIRKASPYAPVGKGVPELSVNRP